MNKDHLREFEFEIAQDEPLFVIGVVSEMIHIPIWTLRKLDDLGIVQPRRLGHKTRCYSRRQITQLKYIHFLMEEKKVNISGIRFILEREVREG